MKKMTLATGLAVGILSLSACTQADSSETVAETKNGNVTEEQFYEELKNQPNAKQVLQQMIITEVLNDKYEVSEEEIDKEVQSIKDQYGEEQFDQVLQQNGLQSEDDLRDALKTSLLQEKAATEGVEVSDEDIQQRYDRMSTEIEASHILVEDEETAKEVKQKVDEGDKSFAELAEEYSTGPTSTEGGSLGFFSAGEMDPAFEDAAYNLEKGEVSEPVQSSFGWHVIKVTDKREKEDVEPLEDMKDQIERELKTQNVDQAAVQEKMNKLLKDAEIDIKVDGYEDLQESFDQSNESSDSEESGESTEEGSSEESTDESSEE
ncbi:foldase PrsA [Pontibacillus halophilus JSM 076056 = DSM 19796]|uniref:Foldase protein PrsA n=1 Tax=Pontibacillus halophilus JSM 076056 = DSM 19796 TaxID=1385510 RepID=A0A0A5GN71_9BACI|nr:peptidylprolyl isomerase [Pontibacillus halophilus]KGX92600.1 foldase PrsA [Pontibacillus halophilus JSM 076056 = DSM 19796]